MNNTVTIITPCYNSEKYILDTIQSVQSQTYKNWEMIIVDDDSTDNSVNIIKNICNDDSRIKLICQKENVGPGAARTLAVQRASGRYIAYLDADDIWMPEKLEKQIKFMQDNKYAFTCTSYEVINNSGKPLKKYIHMPKQLDYINFLKNNILQTVGIMVDLKFIDKKFLFMPNINIGEDAATWLQVLKSGQICFGLDEILAKYRRASKSLSSNKIKSALGTWKMYRKIIKLPLFFAVYCFTRYVILAIKKRVYIVKYENVYPFRGRSGQP